MADNRDPEGAAGVDSVEMPAGLPGSARIPLAAVPLRRQAGEVIQDTVVVICDDGAAFQHRLGDGTWFELEPVPGTQRARERGD